jgi:alpha-glucosidase
MPDLKWWQTAVFYQIYPRSFADGNPAERGASGGDGVGDFKGMVERLDYLKDLGVDALWLSPHYPSPLFDCGYDVADYTDVAPEYGTLDDFRRFLDGAHARGLRVILDLVLNHTSDQHPWFVASRSSRDNPKRDWYIWRDPRPLPPSQTGGEREEGNPPNDWVSTFGGSAWEYDAATRQYYYHYFFKQQPDLNWRNPAVQAAMFDAVRFWLDMGVDGFRLDAIGTLFEQPGLPDSPAAPTPRDLFRAWHTAVNEIEPTAAIEQELRAMFQYQVDQPGVHDVLRALRALVDQYDDRVLVGETDDIAYHGNGDDELHLVFNFPLMRTRRLTPAWVRANQASRLAAIPPGAWPCNTLGNHDVQRVYSHFSAGGHGDALARLSLALVLTLRGTPFLYNGEEIGMTDFMLTDLRQFRDNLGVWAYHALIEFLQATPEAALKQAAQLGRDKCRTPMQWANAPNAGFSPAGVETWLPVNPNYAQGVNVADQLAQPDSLLNFYRRLLRVRRNSPALIAGDYVPLHEDVPDYLAFLRRADAQTCLVMLNFSERAQTARFDLPRSAAHVLFSSRGRGVEALSGLQGAEAGGLVRHSLAPFQIYIAELA